MKYTVTDWLFDKLPHVKFGIIVVKNLENSPTTPYDDALLADAENSIRTEIAPENLKQHPHIAIYRDALEAVGINPNKYTNSVEAMSKRVIKGSTLPRINALVDLCNALALKHRVSLGGHDLKDIHAHLEVRLSNEGDLFLPFGETEYESVAPGEMVFTSGNIVQTRQWLWRQSELGKVTLDSSDIIFQLVGFDHGSPTQLFKAMDELEQILVNRFKVPYDRFVVDVNHRTIEF
ncbi:MAG TPA: hypothetical protein DCS67_10700 [Clostridiales bacterium UBA8960]|nr:hypothetical protein [Clostridiales bacterium UBA8960]